MNTNVNTPTKNSSPPSIDIAEAEKRLSLMTETIREYNLRSGGRATIHALSEGLLLVVVSLPGHRIGTAETDSGIVPAIDGKAVE